MGLLQRLLRPRDRTESAALYEAVVARGRAPHWYRDGGAPDTIDGRFEMIATILSLVLLRLEGDPEGPRPSAQLAERFIDDMDGQLRQIGIGDLVVGKHMGKMMSALGGRLRAFRDAASEAELAEVLRRNLYTGEEPAPDALAHTAAGVRAFREALAATPTAAILAGELPQ